MRKIVIGLALLASLSLNVVSADIEGTRAQQKATHRCQQLAKHLNRRGLTEREYRFLINADCKQQPDRSWTTALYFTEDEL